MKNTDIKIEYDGNIEFYFNVEEEYNKKLRDKKKEK